MRLFTALFPPPEAVAELERALAEVRPGYPELRWSPSERWHITLCFHGEADPAGKLDPFEGMSAPSVRFSGCGHFPGVLWIGVEGAVEPLAKAAGALPDWQAHVTVARSRRAKRFPRLDFTGAEWTASEVALVRSELGVGYTVLERVQLATPSA
ncbi:MULTISPECIES: 2'-5' RNA ligase family protein [Actinosynnema]|uniref:RNA 2',3'-cyclic phosphodiesterase n=2 Tax=Actinosynnema TaxID=40566 RepID=C6WDJ9_ACTMD|nr:MULTISPECIES: 2'-5' RNA ligase family protein [Actinosynnema]ACU39636.1 2'-5' RNA ligase [Actinosynnema mirum DSM 43827]AXX33144.1 2'-5' RNA ligase [Actinosynnema pretiosum subsp. pretiosum]MCP2094067.1 2'-5' RNA ligase [Actinosynnema pretiosum]QUF03013.1 RNA 2',3'-cyclic phosphodiesterase [Actinosynnema pretiosum subsp. pretiosum]